MSKSGDTAVVKDTAALSAVLSGRMSFDAEETNMTPLKDGEPDATVIVVADRSLYVGLRCCGSGLDERAHLPQVLGKEDGEVLVGAEGREW